MTMARKAKEPKPAKAKPGLERLSDVTTIMNADEMKSRLFGIRCSCKASNSSVARNAKGRCKSYRTASETIERIAGLFKAERQFRLAKGRG